MQYLTIAILVSVCVVLFAHPKKEEFPFLLAAVGLGAGGAGGFAAMKSGAKWSAGARPQNVVSFYKDALYMGPRKDYGVGAVQNSLSKGRLGTGIDKENDTYSSLIVPPGMQVQVWEHNNATGKTGVFTPGMYPNLAHYGFNDNISSLKVTANATRCNAIGTQYTTRVLTNGVWTCPQGFTDTNCHWTDGVNGPRQCTR